MNTLFLKLLLTFFIAFSTESTLQKNGWVLDSESTEFIDCQTITYQNWTLYDSEGNRISSTTTKRIEGIKCATDSEGNTNQ